MIFIHFKTEIEECSPLLHDLFQNQNQEVHSFAVCFYLFFRFTGVFSWMIGVFYPVSMTALWMKRLRKGFAIFPKDAQSLDLPPMSGMLRLIFSAQIFHSFFSLCLGLVSTQTAPIVLGMLGCTAQLWDLRLPVFPENPSSSQAHSRPTQTPGTRLCRAAPAGKILI